MRFILKFTFYGEVRFIHYQLNMNLTLLNTERLNTFGGIPNFLPRKRNPGFDQLAQFASKEWKEAERTVGTGT